MLNIFLIAAYEKYGLRVFFTFSLLRKCSTITMEGQESLTQKTQKILMVFISSISSQGGGKKKKRENIPFFPYYSDLMEVLNISTGVISLSCCVSCISGALFTSSCIADRFARTTKFEQGEILFVN